MSSHRPSPEEIRLKIEEALTAISLGNFQVGPHRHLYRDFEECGFYGEDDLWQRLPDFLREIKAKDPVLCYAGDEPPDIAFEPSLNGLELWEYHWDSDSLNFRAYIKFCIQKGRNGQPHYLHVRVHPDRPE
jgi:hypothetical protein